MRVGHSLECHEADGSRGSCLLLGLVSLKVGPPTQVTCYEDVVVASDIYVQHLMAHMLRTLPRGESVPLPLNPS